MTGGARAETSHWIFCSSWGNPALKDNLIALKTFLGCPLEGLSPQTRLFLTFIFVSHHTVPLRYRTVSA